MKRYLLILLFLLFVVASFLAGKKYSSHETANTSATPSEAGAGWTQVETDDSASSHIPGAVRISPERQQMIGVRVEKVERESQSQRLRTLGRVAADENRTYRLLASTDGWVSSVQGSTTGSFVKKNQLMATIYNYNFLTREQQYLYALEFEDRRQKARAQASAPQSSGSPSSAAQQKNTQQSGAREAMPSGTMDMIPVTPGGDSDMSGRAVYSIRDQLEVAKLELYSLGVGDYQIQELARTRKLTSDIEIRSPVTGYVISRNISPQQRFDKGIELFRIADLERVWIVADVFASEAKHIRPGMSARVSLPGYENVFRAVVSDLPPQVDPATRAYKVRLEVDNREYLLRPDAFVDVEFQITLPPALTVSVDALLDSGLKKTVFVDLGGGLFEPREVETGWYFGRRVEITKGLKPGERVAASGTFLIDSESQLALAASAMAGAITRDPACGVDVSIRKAEKAGRKSTHLGKVYYFSSDQCKEQFDKHPERFAIKTEKGS